MLSAAEEFLIWDSFSLHLTSCVPNCTNREFCKTQGRIRVETIWRLWKCETLTYYYSLKYRCHRVCVFCVKTWRVGFLCVRRRIFGIEQGFAFRNRSKYSFSWLYLCSSRRFTLTDVSHCHFQTACLQKSLKTTACFYCNLDKSHRYINQQYIPYDTELEKSYFSRFMANKPEQQYLCTYCIVVVCLKGRAKKCSGPQG